MMGWPVNNIPGTYDRMKVNFTDAPNGDYVESGKMYIGKQKIKLKIVENGKLTGQDTTVQVDGVASWFPVDAQVVEQRGKTVTLASTRDYATQMPCAIIFLNKWADENTPIVEKLIEAFAKGGDQIKSHDEALRFACKVNALVFNDQQRDADAWYKAFKGYQLEDEYGNSVDIGGTRAFNMADVAAYTGISGGTDVYKKVFETFAHIVKEAHPDLVPDTMTYEQAVDFGPLRSVYNRMKNKGETGNVSKTDFATAERGTIAGNASYAIQFATGSSQIKSESNKILDEIGKQLSIANNLFVEIGGHTDNVGNPDKNLTLSQQRADAVKQYILQHNPDLAEDQSRVSSKGYGDTKPLGTDLAKNRRVEIRLYRPQ
jgi:OOP family OmpA-OmpF porin